MALSQMDVPTRQSYIVAVVNEDERTAAAEITNISRNIAQSLSPTVTGYILESFSYLAAPFVLGGLLKIIFDVSSILSSGIQSLRMEKCESNSLKTVHV